MIDIRQHTTKSETGEAAAAFGAQAISDAIARRGLANIVIATGASQFETLAALVIHEEIDWTRVTAFHLDEYIGMPDTHPASFRRYIKERFTGKLPTLGAFHFIDGDAPDLKAELDRINALLDRCPIDVMFAGIGENGHLAFNDPPADFETEEPFLIVELDEACRRQQVGEGWFADLSEVPRQAISMSVRQVVKAREIIAIVPDTRKAPAVKLCFDGEIGPMAPASILRTHAGTTIYLDEKSASLLSAETRRAYAPAS